MRIAPGGLVWTLTVRIIEKARRLGLIEPFEQVLRKISQLLIFQSQQDVWITLTDGMTMTAPPTYSATRYIATGLYEKEVTSLVRQLVKKGMGVVDLGANIGYYTLLASRLVGDSGKVYAFEPDPTAHSYLLRNIEANGCRNVAAFRKAVSNKGGVMTLIRDPLGSESFLQDRGKNGLEVVETVTMDRFFAKEGWPPIHLVKMDVEGSEKAVLEEMRELRRKNPLVQIIMELNSAALQRAGTNREELASALEALGFHMGYVIEKDLKPFSVADSFPSGKITYNLLFGRS
jgi:FkbM family methyltransferase